MANCERSRTARGGTAGRCSILEGPGHQWPRKRARSPLRPRASGLGETYRRGGCPDRWLHRPWWGPRQPGWYDETSLKPQRVADQRPPSEAGSKVSRSPRACGLTPRLHDGEMRNFVFPLKDACRVTACSSKSSRPAATLFDHPVGADEERGWDRQAQRLGSPEINEELEFRRLLYGKVGRGSSLENLIHVGCRTLKQGV